MFVLFCGRMSVVWIGVLFCFVWLQEFLKRVHYLAKFINNRVRAISRPHAHAPSTHRKTTYTTTQLRFALSSSHEWKNWTATHSMTRKAGANDQRSNCTTQHHSFFVPPRWRTRIAGTKIRRIHPNSSQKIINFQSGRHAIPTQQESETTKNDNKKINKTKT